MPTSRTVRPAPAGTLAASGVEPRAYRVPPARLAPGRATAPAGTFVDADCCWLDGRPVEPADWPAVVAAGRVADVRGAFAVAVVGTDGTATLWRDGVGERTLYYAPLADGFAFGPSPAALVRAGFVAPELDLAAAAAYLSYAYVPGRRTLVRGVLEVLPGERVAWGGRGVRRDTVWRLPDEPAAFAPEAELRDELRRRLETAVRRRLPEPGTPLAATLSGGIDSSLVVALARRLHDGPLTAYTVSFGPDLPNELAHAGRMAAHAGVPHRAVELSWQAVLHFLDESVGSLGEPIGDPLTVPNSLLFRAAAEAGTPAVFNGEGGDPCFGGPKNVPMILSELYGHGGAAGGRESAYLRSHLKCYDELGAMLTPGALAALRAEPLEAALAAGLNDPRFRRYVTRLQAVNVSYKGGHHILPKVDALSRPAGAVPRSPLFDRDLVEHSFALPPQLKLRGAVEKYLLKEAVRDVVPAEIVARPKSGMLVPVEAWCLGPMLPAARERLLDGLAKYDIVRRDYLERLLAGRLGGSRPRHGAKVWLLLTLESWLRRVTD